MPAVFKHGALRLYLLRLLGEQPRHGYEVISLLEDRFMGVYAPSAGTVYPRLAKLEAEGLVEHDVEGGRKVYRLTDAGREELAGHTEELRDLEADITASVAGLTDELRDLEADITASVAGVARDVRSEVRASVRGLREELKSAAREVRRETRAQGRRDARKPDLSAAGASLSGLATAASTLTRDALAAARDADDEALQAAIVVLERARAEVLAILAEHSD
jgi:DNA-binding PadR family transcriptional regulator